MFVVAIALNYYQLVIYGYSEQFCGILLHQNKHLVINITEGCTLKAITQLNGFTCSRFFEICSLSVE